VRPLQEGHVCITSKMIKYWGVVCHLRRLCQIRRRVGSEVTTQLVLELVISRLDYCT